MRRGVIGAVICICLAVPFVDQAGAATLRARVRACRSAQRNVDRALRRLLRRGIDPERSQTLRRLNTVRDRRCRGFLPHTVVTTQTVLAGGSVDLDPSDSRSFSIAVGLPNLFFPRPLFFPAPVFPAAKAPTQSGGSNPAAPVDAPPAAVPETSKAWPLPVSGLVVGGLVLLRRRRHDRSVSRVAEE